MATTDETAQHRTVTAVLTLRVPASSGADFATETRRRLGDVAGIESVGVDGLVGLEPQMSATLVTVAVTVESAASVAVLRQRLEEEVAVEGIDRLTDGECGG